MFEFSKKETRLEKFCNELSSENIERPLSDPQEENAQAVAIALLMLFQSGQFLASLSTDKHLKKYYKHVNSDLVLVETIFYLHAMLSYSIMDAAIDGAYDEDEVLSILNSALNGVIGTVEYQSSITGMDQLNIARNYVPNTQSSTERFALILEHSCFGKSPTLKPAINLKNASVETHVGIKVYTTSFAQVQIPACSGIIEKIIEGDFRVCPT